MRADCMRCKEQQPYYENGAMHVLDRKLADRIEVRKCRECGQSYYALPLAQWINLGQAAS